MSSRRTLDFTKWKPRTSMERSPPASTSTSAVSTLSLSFESLHRRSICCCFLLWKIKAQLKYGILENQREYQSVCEALMVLMTWPGNAAIIVEFQFVLDNVRFPCSWFTKLWAASRRCTRISKSRDQNSAKSQLTVGESRFCRMQEPFMIHNPSPYSRSKLSEECGLCDGARWARWACRWLLVKLAGAENW